MCVCVCVLFKLLLSLVGIPYSRKAPISFIHSACPSVRTYQHGSHWAGFSWNTILRTFTKIYRHTPNLINIEQKIHVPSLGELRRIYRLQRHTHWDKIIFFAQHSIFLYWQWLVAQRQTESIVAFPLEQWLRERPTKSRSTYGTLPI